MLHLLRLAEYRAATWPLAPDSLQQQGFVHCSPDIATTLAVANAVYADETEPLVALVLQPERLSAPVRYEAADPAPPPEVGNDVLFPHVYGPIEAAAVRELRYARRDPAGRFVGLESRSSTAEALDLLPHPEGGWFRQTWASTVAVTPDGYPGTRPTATAIYFLLPPGEASMPHVVRSDELWLWQGGGSLAMRVGDRDLTLGPNITGGEHLQVLVPGGTRQAASPAGPDEVLVTCVVSPGFDFADFQTVP